MKKIAIVVSHPIQHFCPMYRSWSKSNDFEIVVFFVSKMGLYKYFDSKFGRDVSWGSLYLDYFNHVFLNTSDNSIVDKKLDSTDLTTRLNKFNPDVILQYGRIYNFNKKLRKWILKNRKIYAYISDSEHNHLENPFKRGLKIVFYSLYFRRIDYFFTVGDANEIYYLNHFVPPKKMIRLGFSIDVLLYEDKLTNKHLLRKSIRDLFSIHENDIVLMVVGKMITVKRHDKLISLLQRLENSSVHRRFHLFVAGSGPEMNSCAKLAKTLSHNVVHFLDFVAPEKLPDFYLASDIYIHPSDYDPHSLAISEAVYLGLPIIVSNLTGSHGFTDDVRDEFNGLVYDQKSDEDLLLKTIKLSDNAIRAVFAANSRMIGLSSQEHIHYGFLSELKRKLNT